MHLTRFVETTIHFLQRTDLTRMRDRYLMSCFAYIPSIHEYFQCTKHIPPYIVKGESFMQFSVIQLTQCSSKLYTWTQ